MTDTQLQFAALFFSIFVVGILATVLFIALFHTTERNLCRMSLFFIFLSASTAFVAMIKLANVTDGIKNEKSRAIVADRVEKPEEKIEVVEESKHHRICRFRGHDYIFFEAGKEFTHYPDCPCNSSNVNKAEQLKLENLLDEERFEN